MTEKMATDGRRCLDGLQSDDSDHLRSLIHDGNLRGVVNFLCETGSSINTSLLTSDNKRTFPLHVAVDVKPEGYQHHLVTDFITMGAVCNILDQNGYAPLYYAAKHNNTVAAIDLLDAGANVNFRTDPSSLTLEKGYICGLNWSQRIRTCKAHRTYPIHMVLKTQCDILNNPVMHFTGRAHCASPVDLVQIFLSHGADCNLYDGSGRAAIHYAVMLNDIHLVGILLDSGADINLKSEENSETPLSLAKDVSMLKFLFSRNADPNVRTKDGRSVLDWSLFSLKRDHTRYLVTDTPIMLQMRNENNESPLIVALYLFRNCTDEQTDQMTQTIHLLLSAGCDPVSDVFEQEDWNTLKQSLSTKPKGLTVLKTLEDLASNPRPLLHLCTIRIRGILQRNILTSVKSLPLPTKLKETLTLAHLT